MDKVCFIVKAEHEDKSVSKLTERLQRLGLECICREVVLPEYFSVGWGRAAAAPGLNRRPPRNKLVEIQRLRERGVPTVPFDVDFTDAIARAWDDLRSRGKRAVLFGRKKQHHQGKDIKQFVLGEQTREEQLAVACPAKRDFWTQVVPRVAEYRVHAFCGRVDHAAKKVPKSEEARTALIWNRENCDFVYGRPVSEAVKAAALAAVAAYGLDFGAVDVLEDSEGACYVLEVNLRPGLNEEMADYYAQKIAAAARAQR